MFFYEYQKAVTRTMNSGETSPRLRWANWGLGLAGEAGEVADLVKKHVSHKHPLDKEKLIAEVGDCLWYCAAVCQELGVQLGDVAVANIKKLEKRYPDGFSTEASIARVDTKGDKK